MVYPSAVATGGSTYVFLQSPGRSLLMYRWHLLQRYQRFLTMVTYGKSPHASSVTSVTPSPVLSTLLCLQACLAGLPGPLPYNPHAVYTLSPPSAEPGSGFNVTLKLTLYV